MRRRAAAIAFLTCAALPLFSQQPQAALDVQTANGESTFHIGERIPLKLTFTSPDDTHFFAFGFSNGRGTEFNYESFKVSPSTGWSDPLVTYFAQRFPLLGHGWSMPPLLKSKPIELATDLNQWVRFEQPGDYAVTVISHRVHEGSLQEFPLSKTIQLHIVPATSEWQTAQIKAILAQRAGNQYNQPSEPAMADLRYLATPAAIDVMTDWIRATNYWYSGECSLGLLGLPDSLKATAIASLDKRIGEPDFPVSDLFFSTWSLLHVTPGSKSDSIDEQRRSFESSLWPTVLAAVPQKEPAARAQTIQTLVFLGRNIKSTEIRTQMGSLLSASFLDLDQRSQVDDLRQHWDLLDKPGFIPVLETLAKKSIAGDDPNGWDSVMDLKSLALRHWYSLDPDAAHREILAQIGSSSPTLSAKALAFLPPEQLPQLEPLWAQAFLDTTNQFQEQIIGSLLVHFGAGAAAPQMLAKLNAPEAYPCDAHVMAFAYLARFKPELAGPLLERDLTGDKPSCDGSLLRLISQQATPPVLNDIAVKMLNHNNPRMVGDAVEYLTSYGRPQDQAPLWRRYVGWTAKWRSKAARFDRLQAGVPNPDGYDLALGDELAHALLANQGWLADSALIARVRKGCVGESMCASLQQEAQSAIPPYRVFVPDVTNPSGNDPIQTCNVAQYGPMTRDLLEAKLDQFPAGTKFLLWPGMPDNEAQRNLDAEFQTLFRKHGMSLEKSPN